MRPHFLGNRVGGGLIAAAIDHDIKTGFGQLVGDAAPDILAGPGDQCCFSVALHDA
jgi:hypothetical protein